MFSKKPQKLKIINIPLPSGDQKILIGKNIFDIFINKQLTQKYYNFIILIDDNVLYIYKKDINRIKRLLNNPTIIAIKPNENSKSLNFLNCIFEKCCKGNLSRKSCVLAIGGGIVGDISGFIASIYMRGIDFIFIPTTLMAQADTIIHKVAVNHKSSKNIAGSFYSPVLTICDINFLQTLNDKEISMGFSEIIKHSIIDSARHFNYIKSIFKKYKKNYQKYPWEEIIYKSLKTKSKFVTKDPFDKSGHHKGLSYGHTFANVLEEISSFNLRHGEAVALGMKFSAIISRNMGLMPQNIFDEQNAIIKEFALPTTIPKLVDKKTIVTLFKKDKISDKGEINLVVLEKFGKILIKKNISLKTIKKTLDLFNTIQ